MSFFATLNEFFSSSFVTKWKNIFFPGYTDQNEPLKPKISIIFFFEFHCRRSTLCIGGLPDDLGHLPFAVLQLFSHQCLQGDRPQFLGSETSGGSRVSIEVSYD